MNKKKKFFSLVVVEMWASCWLVHISMWMAFDWNPKLLEITKAEF